MYTQRKSHMSDYWDTNPDLLHDWKFEVSNGDTLRGYHEWVEAEARATIFGKGAEELPAVADKELATLRLALTEEFYFDHDTEPTPDAVHKLIHAVARAVLGDGTMEQLAQYCTSGHWGSEDFATAAEDTDENLAALLGRVREHADTNGCCECGSTEHVCQDCPVFGGPES